MSTVTSAANSRLAFALWGAECRFKHILLRERSNTPRPKPKPAGTTPCPFYLKGTCKFGDKCKDSHKGKPGGRSPSPSPKKGAGKGKGKGKGKTGPAAPAVAALTIPSARSTGEDAIATVGGPVSILKAPRVPAVASSATPGPVALAAHDYLEPPENYRSWLLDTGVSTTSPVVTLSLLAN